MNRSHPVVPAPGNAAHDPQHTILHQETVDALVEGIVERLRGKDRQLVDRKELAASLGIGERTVGALVSRKELPDPLILGGLRRWDWNEVLQYLHARRGRKPRRGRGIYARQTAITKKRANGNSPSGERSVS